MMGSSFSMDTPMSGTQARRPIPVLADGSEGLLSTDEIRLVRRLLPKATHEANVFLCMATAGALEKLD